TWHEAYGESEKLIAEIARDIKAAAQESESSGRVDLYRALPDDLADIHKGDLKRRLGKALASHVGSQFDESGLHLEKAATDRRSGAIYWKVAGLQVSQVSMPQKAESPRTNYPPESLQSDASAIFEEKYFPVVEENKPAKPANLQIEGGETGDDPPLDLQERVRTPRGSGMVVQRWQDLIGVKLDKTHEVIYFRGKEEIVRILPHDTTRRQDTS